MHFITFFYTTSVAQVSIIGNKGGIQHWIHRGELQRHFLLEQSIFKSPKQTIVKLTPRPGGNLSPVQESVRSIIDSNRKQGNDLGGSVPIPDPKVPEPGTEPSVSMSVVGGKKRWWKYFSDLFGRHLPFPKNAKPSGLYLY